VNTDQMNELLYQAIETEIGGQSVYEAAIRCADSDGLREEWTKYLDETREHERILRDVFEQLGLDVEAESPGRTILRAKAKSLVQAMESALAEGGQPMAQLVAAESVVEAETKDHQNWELIGLLSEKTSGKTASALKAAFDQVEEQEDEHLYHTIGWARELWIESLGLPAVIPPPEEAKSVKTAIGAARAKQSREQML
jgi:rubrerythrin